LEEQHIQTGLTTDSKSKREISVYRKP